MDRRSDIFSMGVVLWELLTGKRMFGHSGARKAFLDGGRWEVFPPSAFNAEVQRPLDEVVSHAISWSADERFDTAAEFAAKLETALGPATRNEVAAWVEKRAEGSIKRQRVGLTSTTASAEPAHEPRRRESIPSFDDATVHFTPDEALLLSAQMDRGKGAMFSDADVLRTRLSRILDADPAGLNRTLPMLRTMSPWLRPARPGGRSLLTASAFVLLLLVGMRLSRETSGAAAAPVAREARPPVRQAAPASRPVASPGIDVGSLPIAVARDDTPPEVAPLDGEPIKRASTLARTGRSSCSPPFTLDAFGIKRIKLHCL
jgi:hypothetical protein